MKNLLVVGDLHLQEKEPKYSQTKDFLNWLFTNPEFNTKDNGLIFLGDLVETIDSPHELLELYVDYFLNKSKFSFIKILQGNHDANIASSLLSTFRPLPNVEVITFPSVQNIEGLTCLFLPYYYHENKHITSMRERYSNLYTEKEYAGVFDYCFHHTEDETNHYPNSKNYSDLSKLKVNNYLCGHIHSENLSKKGRFLGSPIFNSITEKDKKPLIASIDISSKHYTLIKVPVWLKYYDVTYPDVLPKTDTPYSIFTVHDSLNKEETIKYYIKMALEQGFTFYSRKIFNKRNTELLVERNIDTSVKKSLLEHFQDYSTINKIDTKIVDVCLEVIKKKESC